MPLSKGLTHACQQPCLRRFRYAFEVVWHPFQKKVNRYGNRTHESGHIWLKSSMVWSSHVKGDLVENVHQFPDTITCIGCHPIITTPIRIKDTFE